MPSSKHEGTLSEVSGATQNQTYAYAQNLDDFWSYIVVFKSQEVNSHLV